MAVRRLFLKLKLKPHQTRTEGRESAIPTGVLGGASVEAALELELELVRPVRVSPLFSPPDGCSSLAIYSIYPLASASASLFSSLTPSRQPWTAQIPPPRCEPHRQIRSRIRSRIQTQTMTLANTTRPPPPRSQTGADRRRLSSLNPIMRLPRRKRSPPILSTTS